jgi:uncharacterized protein (TIGR02300 family)
VAKPELGSKRLCASCGAKFYDLNKSPITCPKCGTPLEVVVPVATRPRPGQRAVAREPAVEVEEAENAELISLEEADSEAEGKKVPSAAEGADEDVETEETIEGDAEDTFIEQEEEDDTDVSEIIDGDIEDEEET